MKFIDLRDYAKNIEYYCEQKYRCIKMCEALDEDLGIDRYQDTQPGGGNCEFQNRSEYEKYSNLYDSITSDVIFGELYKHTDPDERILLNTLFDKCMEQYDVCFDPDFSQTHQMCQVLAHAADTKLADKVFTAEDIEFVIAAAQHFVEAAQASYDEKNDKTTFVLDAKQVESYHENYLERMVDSMAPAPEKGQEPSKPMYRP